MNGKGIKQDKNNFLYCNILHNFDIKAMKCLKTVDDDVIAEQLLNELEAGILNIHTIKDGMLYFSKGDTDLFIFYESYKMKFKEFSIYRNNGKYLEYYFDISKNLQKRAVDLAHKTYFNSIEKAKQQLLSDLK